MSVPPRIAIAYRNEPTLRENERICAVGPADLVTSRADPRGWPHVEETGDKYLENALLKARAVAAALDLPALADDSGIEVDALDGAPGPRSARFAGEVATDAENLAKLLTDLRGREVRTARYRCVATVAWPDGSSVWTEGTCEGRIVEDTRGARGFGYDPAFVPDGETRTMAELTDEEKDRISHRGRAFRAMREVLATR